MSSETVSRPRRTQPTKLSLRVLHEEIKRLRERVEDLEDLRELNDAIARNDAKVLIPWEKAKAELGIEG